MRENSADLFQRAISALFPGDAPAHSLMYWTGQDPFGIVCDLRAVRDPTLLPSYWTLSVPKWYDPESGTMDFDGTLRTRQLVQEWLPDPSGTTFVSGDVFQKNHPFLVLEVDYLICHKDDGKNLSPEEVTRRKRVQVEAMTQAFLRTKFPFATLVHSGSKSVHAYIRLNDSAERLSTFRSQQFDHLLDLCWMVFGNYDRSVLKESGRVRLVRTPGALREDGAPQQILAVGKPTTVDELFQWCYSQLSQEAMEELRTRQPVVTNAPVRFYHFWQDEWKRDLVKDHNPGERGTHWFHVSKKLAMAGAKRPTNTTPMTDQWDASWLWWFSAFTFDHYAKGWFFSTDPQDHQQANERSRWWGAGEVMTMVQEQRKATGTDQTTAQVLNVLFDNMQPTPTAILPAVEQSPGAGGLPPAFQPPVDPERDMMEETKKEKKKKAPAPEKEAFDPVRWANMFFEKVIPRELLIYCGELAGKQWWYYNGKVWAQTSGGAVTKLLEEKIMHTGFLCKHRAEVMALITHWSYTDVCWQDNKNAIAFANGTLYLNTDPSKIRFEATFDPKDRLRNQVQYAYDPIATCERWERCMERFLPDEARRAVFQEMFGYTLLPGQPYQAFFLLLGTGSNFKSTAIKVLEELHKDSREAIALAGLANDFALGTVFSKRLAIDGDADSLNKRDMGDNARILSIVKAWTGGDSVKVAAKSVQGWSTPINAKLILAANRRPRFVDPTKGVWRRLRILKFEVAITPGEEIADYDQLLIKEEMVGIILWAIKGLFRLLHQGRFTTSASMKHDLEEYQLDSDNTLQFIKEFMVKDDTAGWHDLRPFYAAYREYAEESGSGATALNEFKNRLIIHGCMVDQPPVTETVHGMPAGSVPHPEHHHWAIKGYRCLHPTARLSPTIGSYAPVPKVIDGLAAFTQPQQVQ